MGAVRSGKAQADELWPYLAPRVRAFLDAANARVTPGAPGAGGGGSGSGGGGGATTTHTLASQIGLSTKHTISDGVAGHTLRVTGPTTAHLAQLQHADLGGVTEDQHHARAHALATPTALGSDHTISGGTAGQTLRVTGSNTAKLDNLYYSDLQGAGAALDVVGWSATNTIGKLTPTANASGGVSALLRSNAGALTLDTLTAANVNASTKVRTPLIDTAAGDLSLSPAGNVKVTSATFLKSDHYASQTTGWGISYAGAGDFRYLFADEMHVKSFIADLEQALAGGQIIAKSVAVLAVDFTAPANSATATLRVKDLPSAPNMSVFEAGDVVRLRTFSRSAGSLTVADCWGVVTGYADQPDGTQTWTFTRSAPPYQGGMATGTVVAADSLVLDYGTDGNGYYEVNAIDGVYATNSPYAQVVTWAGHPATGLTVRTRMGNLNGIFGTANEYGLYAGSGVTNTSAYLRVSNLGVALNNVPIRMYNDAVNTGMWSANGQLDIGFSGISVLADRDFTIHATGYIRLGRANTNDPNLFYSQTGGYLALRNGSAIKIRLDNDGSSYFAGRMTIGTEGEIVQGTGTLGAVGSWSGSWGSFTGLRVGRDGNVGRIGGYSAGVPQWSADSNGRLTAGGGNVRLDASGITVVGTLTDTFNDIGSYTIESVYGSGNVVALFGYKSYFGSSTARVGLGNGNSGTEPQAYFLSSGAARYAALTAGSAALRVDHLSGYTPEVSSNAQLRVTDNLVMSWNSPWSGYGIKANPSGSWARGLNFNDSSDTRIGGIGANGGPDTLTHLFMGVAYNDWTLRVTLATDLVEMAGEVAAPTFNAADSFERDGVAGGIFIPVTARYLTDTGGVTWNNTSGRNTGSYTFNMQASTNGSIPSDAIAVYVVLGVRWGTSGEAYNAGAYGVGLGGSGTSVVVRSHASNITNDGMGIVRLGTNGDIQVDIAGGNATAVYLRLIGYFT